jgi:hypothetical protein
LRDKVTSSARLIARCWSRQCVSAFTLTGHSARAWIENCQTPQRVDEGPSPVG